MARLPVFLVVLFTLLLNISSVIAGSACTNACWIYLIDDICGYDRDLSCLCDFDNWRHFEQCVLIKCMENGQSGYMSPDQTCGYVDVEERALAPGETPAPIKTPIPIETPPPNLLEKDGKKSHVKRVFSICPFIRGTPCLVAEEEDTTDIKMNDVLDPAEARRIAVQRIHHLCLITPGPSCGIKLAYREGDGPAVDDGPKEDVAGSKTTTQGPDATRSAVERVFSICPFIRGSPCLVELKYGTSTLSP